MMVNRKAPSTHEDREFPATGPVDTWEQNLWRWYMTMVPLMWAVWSALVLVLAALYLYRSRLERDEEDQIFLDDSFEHERSAQAAIVARVNKIQPVLRVSMILASIATVFVIGYYIMDIVNRLK